MGFLTLNFEFELNLEKRLWTVRARKRAVYQNIPR